MFDLLSDDTEEDKDCTRNGILYEESEIEVM
jgi:hypothetical protein